MRLATKVVCLCVLWYVSGSGNSIAAKKALSLFPYPMTVSSFENNNIQVEHCTKVFVYCVRRHY